MEKQHILYERPLTFFFFFLPFMKVGNINYPLPLWMSKLEIILFVFKKEINTALDLCENDKQNC